MNALLDKRLVLVTGKGGVGRSTVAAALARVAQRAGKRVLLAEIGDGSEDYSALARLFGLDRLPARAAEITPGIDGSQLLSDTGIELFLTSVLRVPLLAKTALGFEPLRRLLSAAPSFREMGVFFHLLTYLRAELSEGVPRHELILVDMPATGHTLALTGLPDVLLRLVTRGPIADGLREGKSYVNDPKRAGAYVVTLPETLPISEALELLEGLERTSVPRGGIFVNRVPVDDFSEAETAALEPFIARQPIFGAERFHRIKTARAAMQRMREATSIRSLSLPESDALGPALIDELVRALETTSFSSPGAT